MRKTPTSQITFLYYDDLNNAAEFYEEILGLELVEAQSFAKIYRVSSTSFIGAVSGERGFHRPQEKNAVLVTLVVDDPVSWFDHIVQRGLKIIRPLEEYADIQIQCFFFEGPGGYTFEIQKFLRPDLLDIFHK